MVVLAATICTKGGKVIVSRQFLPTPRSRVEGLIASFPKLISTSSQHHHTTLDTEEVRFVYQPLEDLYLVLITSKKSNILQDIDTLHLFARVVSEVVRNVDETEVGRNAFELVNVFDEIVSMGGYRENIGLQQVKTITEMESHEEKIQEMIAKNKELEAKEELKRKMKQIEMQKKQMTKMGGGMPGIPGMTGGFGSSMMGGPMGMAGGMTLGGTGVQTGMSQMSRSTFEATAPTLPVASSHKIGMKLGSGKKNDFMEVFKQDAGVAITKVAGLEEGIHQMSIGGVGTNQGAGQAIQAMQTQSFGKVPMDSVHIILEERLQLTVNRDGGLQNMEIKGDLMLRVSEEDKSRLKVKVKAVETEGLQFKTHPSIDKKSFATDSVICMKDAAKSLPLNTPQSVLKWRFVTKDEGKVPLSVNVWPSPSGDGKCDVVIEYELENEKLELKDVVVAIPLPPSSTPNITSFSGSYSHDRSRNVLLWSIPLIDASSRDGTLEFSCPGEEPGMYFPVNVSWQCDGVYCDIEVLDVTNADSNQPLKYSKEVSLGVEIYQIV